VKSQTNYYIELAFYENAFTHERLQIKLANTMPMVYQRRQLVTPNLGRSD
jgi:hypothetical protein